MDNIYVRKNINFKKLLEIGEQAEKSIIDAFNKTNRWHAEKVDRKLGFDILVSCKETGKTKNVEVKSHKGSNRAGQAYNTLYAEVVQNTDIGSVPEYLTSNHIDYVIHINQHENVFYLFDHKKFQNFVLEHTYMATQAKYATSSGIKVGWQDENAGFLFKFAM